MQVGVLITNVSEEIAASIFRYPFIVIQRVVVVLTVSKEVGSHVLNPICLTHSPES
jgi:hypothetical protein